MFPKWKYYPILITPSETPTVDITSCSVNGTWDAMSITVNPLLINLITSSLVAVINSPTFLPWISSIIIEYVISINTPFVESFLLSLYLYLYFQYMNMSNIFVMLI